MTTLVMEGAAATAAAPRPPATREQLARRLDALAVWQVQTGAHAPIDAAARMGVDTTAFSLLCDAVEDVIAVAAKEPVYGPDVDPDRADALAAAAYGRALDAVVDAAARTLNGGTR